jgi:asparagine synthase (glutamine-hydrolysing)
MCGIAGVYRLGARPPSEAERAVDRALVATMLGALEYRGPDDHGLESIGRVTLGVRRLAILDVQGGHQPLADPERRVWAIQNGEIYNFPDLRRELETRHRFRTHTDTEILPFLYQEYGLDLARSLRGMFAFAVYDVAAEGLLLARDPMGVKPLYVAESGDRVLFASEMKAILCDSTISRELDPQALRRFLALGFVPGEATAFRAIRKVRPGVRIWITPTERETSRYVAWPSFLTAPPPTFEAAVARSRELLTDSATAMLLSDRPVGILLSGGLDSSVLAAALPEAIRRETRTFTIGFEDGGLHDECPFARTVAKHLGTKHREIHASLDIASELTRVVTLLDEPCADPAAVPAHLVARAASEEVTVLLSGTGGDEVFGGYRRYRLGSLLRRMRWLPRAVAAAGARALSDRDQHRSSLGGERLVMARKLLEARARDSFLGAYLSTLEPATPERWSEAVADGLAIDGVPSELRSEMVAELGGEPRDDASVSFLVDHLYYLPDDLLLKEDRTTMGVSVEGRVPFLDRALVEYAAGLPLEYRFDGRHGKRMLRAWAREVLPPEIAERGKHGFSVPIEDWLRGPLVELAGDTFSGNGSGVFRMPVLRRWLDEHRARRDRSGPLWAALTFELWWRNVASASPEALRAAGRPVAAHT